MAILSNQGGNLLSLEPSLMIREEVFNSAAAEKLTSVLLFVYFDCRGHTDTGVMNRKSLIIDAALQHSPLELAANLHEASTVTIERRR